MKMKIFAFFSLMFTLTTSASAGWWNEGWAYKKKISLDKVALQQSGVTADPGSIVLVRLHTGNFAYFLDVADAGKDIRFIAADDKTPLKFSIEKFDAINEMALIWVKLPDNIATAEMPTLWMYYGNPQAVDGQDNAGIYPTERFLNYHFGNNGVNDSTAYANNPVEATSVGSSNGVIADAAQFSGAELIRIPDAPSIQMNAEEGWHVSLWFRIDDPQTDAVLFQRGEGVFSLDILYENLSVSVTDTAGEKLQLSIPETITMGNWHHVVVSGYAAGISVFLDGLAAGSLSAKLGTLSGDMTIGAAADGQKGLVGFIDEFSISGKPAIENDVKFAHKIQGLGGSVLIYGDDISEGDSDDGEPSYMMATLDNVSVDGWVVIGMLSVMMLISWMVMIGKGIVLTKIRKENANFMGEFNKLGANQIDELNRPDSEDDEDALESPLMLSLTGGHEKFQGSSIYRIYHAGVEEINQRLPRAVGADVGESILSVQSVEAIRSSMDATMVREIQKLNSQMVLLTIAISGGPFLGLLGTVLGVMITFAAIAVQGEVNVNAIAPGVAAALATTVAGLVVAIPALFGYNYLGGRIKEVTADMYVFVDEFIARMAERYS